MKLITTQTTTKEIEVSAPMFFKKGKMKYLGLLNEKTACRVTILDDGKYVNIMSSAPEDLKTEIGEAFYDTKEWEPSTEQEFMSVYDDAWESIRLRPKLESYSESLSKVMEKK